MCGCFCFWLGFWLCLWRCRRRCDRALSRSPDTKHPASFWGQSGMQCFLRSVDHGYWAIQAHIFGECDPARHLCVSHERSTSNILIPLQRAQDLTLYRAHKKAAQGPERQPCAARDLVRSGRLCSGVQRPSCPCLQHHLRDARPGSCRTCPAAAGRGRNRPRSP